MTKLQLPILALFFLGLAGLDGVRADDTAPTRIGRISAIDGIVSIRSAAGESTDSAANDPIAAGMSVRTGDRTRVRLSIGPDAIALSAATRIEVGRLDESATQIAVPQGRIGIHLARLDPDRSVEIDLPRGGVWLVAPGDYDIAAGDDKTPARIAALDGSARVVAAGIDATVTTGTMVVLNGGTPVTAKLDSGARDEFVAWWRPPAGDTVGAQALRVVSPEMTGYDTLDANGIWEPAEGYGEVWYPNVVAQSWTPYRYGHWRWLAPWGWTWVDDMPWGFATSHYGRWARIDDRWAWVPGPRLEHPVYAPALVAFLGTRGVGLSYPDGNGPAVAWFPLAPGEPYWPSYTTDLDTIRRINAGAVHDLAAIGPAANGNPPAAIVNGDYLNRRFASVVPRPVFVAGRAVAPALIQLPGRRLDNAPLLAGSPQIPPTVSSPAPPQVAGAAHALARILAPRATASTAQTAGVLRGSQHPARLATAVPPNRAHAADRSPRGRIIAVAASRPPPRSRVMHVAAVHHQGRLR